MIWFCNYTEHRYDENEVALLSSIGNQISTAISKAKIHKELSKKSRYELIISTVTRSVHQSIDPQEVFENAVSAVNTNIEKADMISIYLVEGKEAILKSGVGHPKWFIERVKTIPHPKGFIWKTIIDNKPLLCMDTDTDTTMGEAGRDLGIKSYISVPIRYKNKAIGCINLDSIEKNSFNIGDLFLLENVVQQIEVALKNASQAEALAKSEEQLKKNLIEISKKNRFETIISSVTKSVHSSIDLSEVLQSAAESILKNMDGVDAVGIYMVEEKLAILKAHTGLTENFISRAGKIRYPNGLTWKTLIDNKVLYCADVEKDKYIGPAGIQLGTKSYVSMPIGNVQGLMAVSPRMGKWQ